MIILDIDRASQAAQWQRIRLPMQETWVPFLGREDPLEKGMATQSSILAWRIPCTEEPGGLQSMGSQSQARPKRLSRHACPEIVVDFYSILIFYYNCSEIYCGFEIDPTSQPHDWVSAMWNGETPCGFCFGRDFCDLGMQLSDLFIPDADT